MFDTVAISDLQKAPSRAIKSTKGFKYILSNNKKQGLLIDKNMMEFLGKMGTLEEYEDYVLAKSPLFKEARNEGRQILETENYSECVNFEELCQSK